MIPNFKTYIGESVWSDIHKRSNGDTIRKEDDINNLDIDELEEYLDNRYKLDYFSIECDHISILIPIIDTSDSSCISNIKFNLWEKKISVPSDVEKYVPDVIKKLKEVYYTEVKQGKFLGRLYIYPSEDNKTCTPNFFINVLDFIIENTPEEKLNIKRR